MTKSLFMVCGRDFDKKVIEIGVLMEGFEWSGAVGIRLEQRGYNGE